MTDTKANECVAAFKPLADAAQKVLESRVILTMDGNKWCAHRPDFINLQESLAGFGDTEIDAIHELLKAYQQEYSAAFEAARGAEHRMENLRYDPRPYKPASYGMDLAAAIKEYSAADARFERAFAATSDLKAEINLRRRRQDVESAVHS